MTATLKEEIAMLQKQISQLENFKQELELLLKEEQQRSADLQAKLETAGANALELHNQHLLAMEELEKKMLERAKKQLEELNALMDVRIKEAAGKARRDALQEMDQKISEAVSKVEAKAKAELEDERQKAADAGGKGTRQDAQAGQGFGGTGKEGLGQGVWKGYRGNLIA
jgi:chromosome segregation ATPase